MAIQYVLNASLVFSDQADRDAAYNVLRTAILNRKAGGQMPTLVSGTTRKAEINVPEEATETV